MLFTRRCERKAGGKSGTGRRLLVGNIVMAWHAPSAASSSAVTLLHTNGINMFPVCGSNLVVCVFIAWYDRSCSYRLTSHLFVYACIFVHGSS